MKHRQSARATSFDRRALLAGSAALAAGAAALALAHPARAFSQEDADAKTQALYQNVCGSNADHAKLVGEARAALESRQPERMRLFDINSQGVACPVCGCRVSLDPATPGAAKD